MSLSTELCEVRQSPIHGLGVFARQDLPAGTYLGDYAGRRYTARQAAKVAWDDRVTYLFGLSDGSTIDGADGGNATRHLNHSCAPNCEAEEYTGPRRRQAVALRTRVSVPQGQELLIDYSLTIDETSDASDYPCGCGTAECRGTMAGVVEAS